MIASGRPDFWASSLGRDEQVGRKKHGEESALVVNLYQRLHPGKTSGWNPKMELLEDDVPDFNWVMLRFRYRRVSRWYFLLQRIWNMLHVYVIVKIRIGVKVHKHLKPPPSLEDCTCDMCQPVSTCAVGHPSGHRYKSVNEKYTSSSRLMTNPHCWWTRFCTSWYDYNTVIHSRCLHISTSTILIRLPYHSIVISYHLVPAGFCSDYNQSSSWWSEKYAPQIGSWKLKDRWFLSSLKAWQVPPHKVENGGVSESFRNNSN